MKLLRRLGNISDAAEVSIPVLLGTGLFLGLYVGVPLAVTSALFQASRPGAGVAVLLLTALLVAANVRDALRRRWSWVSGGAAGLWVLCVGYATILLLLE